ncbi:MAG: GNAT family N-acetyltransferase [Rhodobacteraceae bacterium]|nr:GNAT family N-acetyltransferase [Paracoccaceae bacterium]
MIRPAGPGDVGVLRRLLQALSDQDGGPAVAPEAALLAHGFGARPLYRALLAEDAGGEALGTIVFFPDFSTHRGEPGLFVQDIYVVPAARGRGLGRALLGAALRAQDWGAAYVTLGVEPANAAARRFYAREGFRPRGYDFLIADGPALERLMTA